jgi:hypothetical protein
MKQLDKRQYNFLKFVFERQFKKLSYEMTCEIGRIISDGEYNEREDKFNLQSLTDNEEICDNYRKYIKDKKLTNWIINNTKSF